MTTRIAYCLPILAAIISTGCGRSPSGQKSPVAEVAINESGVQLTAASNSISQADWPGWRGAQQMGVATDQALPTQWSDSSNIRWTADIPGRGHGSPIVVGDSVYVPTAIESKQEQRVLSFAKDTGEVRWDKLVHRGGFPSPNEIHKKGTNANGSLTSNGELLFAVFFNSAKIIATALDLDGKEVWKRDIGAFSSKFGYAPSPILYQSFVIVAADNWGGGYLAAFDAQTGEVAWRVARGETSSYSSPMIANLGGRDQLIISGCDAVTSYDPATGDEIWRTPCISEATCGTAITDGDRIFASGGYPDKETVCLSADGKKLWSNNTKIYEPSMIAGNGCIFAVSDDGIAYCWDSESGNTQWKERLGGNFSASPMLCNGMIYVSNLNGDTFVLKATADDYQEISKNKLGDDCYASPAVSDGAIFLRVGKGAGSDRRESLICVAE
jgi:outer membrane protein assembly factor BamB